MNPDHRRQIVDALVHFQDSDIAQVFDKWHFYFNKQHIRLTNIDSKGRYVSQSLGCPGEIFKINDADIIAVYSSGSWQWPLNDETEWQNQDAMIAIRKISGTTIVSTPEFFYWVDKIDGTIMRTSVETGVHETLGYGTLTVSYGKTRSGDKLSLIHISEPTRPST